MLKITSKKPAKKAGMIFACNFDRRKTKPLIYIEFCRQACLPSLVFGEELFSLTTTQLNQLERCQQLVFLKLAFYIPHFAPAKFLLKVSGLNSAESKIDVKKVLFLDRLITDMKMASVVKSLFFSSGDSFFEAKYPAVGVLPRICEALHNYDLFHHFKLWHFPLVQ